jgi:O-glycosyl hydrolase
MKPIYGLAALIPLLLIFGILAGGCVRAQPAAAPSQPLENDSMQQSTTPTPETVLIRIDPQTEYQTIEGFGAAGAWWAQDTGGWEDEKRNLVADLLFDRAHGAGMSIYRYNIGGGNGENIADPWRRAETFEIAPGQYDWLRDANAMWMLQAAHARGVENFVAFVNSPPARMTVSGLTTGEKDGKSNLRPEMYGDFARYLVDVVRHLREEEGIPVRWISPLNEPQWAWRAQNGQEGSHYGPQEVLELSRVLLRTLQASELAGDVQLSLFESGEWKSSDVYIDVLARDPEVWAALPHLAIHSYWSTRSDKQAFMRYWEKHHGDKPLWMSEWTEMQEGRDAGMASALLMAATMHDDLTIPSVTSWQYWIAVSKYQYRDGLIYVNPLDRAILPAKRLWVMGNYARFIRPGFVRVEAVNETGAEGETLQVSAYRSPDDQRWVVVAVNHADRPVDLQFAAADDLLPLRAEQFETSAQADLAMVADGPTASTWRLAPESVTTFVLYR